MLLCAWLQGAKATLSSANWSNDKSLWVAAVIGAGLAFLTAVVVVPLLWRKIVKHFDE